MRGQGEHCGELEPRACAHDPLTCAFCCAHRAYVHWARRMVHHAVHDGALLTCSNPVCIELRTQTGEAVGGQGGEL